MVSCVPNCILPSVYCSTVHFYISLQLACEDVKCYSTLNFWIFGGWMPLYFCMLVHTAAYIQYEFDAHLCTQNITYLVQRYEIWDTPTIFIYCLFRPRPLWCHNSAPECHTWSTQKQAIQLLISRHDNSRSQRSARLQVLITELLIRNQRDKSPAEKAEGRCQRVSAKK